MGTPCVLLCWFQWKGCSLGLFVKEYATCRQHIIPRNERTAKRTRVVANIVSKEKRLFNGNSWIVWLDPISWKRNLMDWWQKKCWCCHACFDFRWFLNCCSIWKIFWRSFRFHSRLIHEPSQNLLPHAKTMMLLCRSNCTNDFVRVWYHWETIDFFGFREIWHNWFFSSLQNLFFLHKQIFHFWVSQRTELCFKMSMRLSSDIQQNVYTITYDSSSHYQVLTQMHGSVWPTVSYSNFHGGHWRTSCVRSSVSAVSSSQAWILAWCNHRYFRIAFSMVLSW